MSYIHRSKKPNKRSAKKKKKKREEGDTKAHHVKLLKISDEDGGQVTITKRDSGSQHSVAKGLNHTLWWPRMK